ncbi:MAG: zinc ribbon domain-containing protein [Anaerolineales bacterium]|jgi:predicted amidophosphoribosyltransferase|nr:zinc ribbon domain-containing protein [Anaerolineales bacterium]
MNQANATQTIPCPQCGQPIQPSDAFCIFCGARLAAQAPAPAGGGSTRITTVDASGGGVVAIGKGARAIKMDGGTYTENQVVGGAQQLSSAAPPVRRCAHCQSPLAEGYRFCSRCGRKVEPPPDAE